jgi:hypothetical protein
MFLYRDILKKSLAVTFEHKNLWFFGIFAALLAGVGRYSMSFSRIPEDWNSSFFSALAVFYSQTAAAGNVFINLAAIFKRDPVSSAIFISFLLIIILVLIFLFWLAVISQAGLINNAAKIIRSNGKKEGATIQEGISVGVKKFWPVLGYNLIAATLTCFFAVLVGLPLIFLTAQSDASVYLLYILLFILFIPLALIISFLTKYAVCFSVIKGQKFVDSFVEACLLFGQNWLISLEMALILFITDFLFVLAMGISFLVLAIPYLFIAKILSLIVFLLIGADIFFPVAVVIGLFLALVLVIVAGAIITCFKTVAWTEIFINLVDKKGGLSKIVRLAEHFKK